MAEYCNASEHGDPDRATPSNNGALGTNGGDLKLERETDRSLVEGARQLLGACWLFRNLGPDERRALFARVRIRIRTFVAGETIFQKGSPGDHMMAVVSGNVRISVASANGQVLELSILTPGDLFGEIALLDGKERTADATAATECSLAILDRSEILSFLERHPNVWPLIVEVLCDRLRKSDAHLAGGTMGAR
jgi:CRP/FNR family transcriptional regulator, cyclic AMP receptor protein